MLMKRSDGHRHWRPRIMMFAETLPPSHERVLTKAKLRFRPAPYQLKGIRWLVRNEGKSQQHRQGNLPRGSVLADEMGLGKTFQITAAALIGDLVLADGYTPPTLVVCPKNLLTQWREELLQSTCLEPQQIVLFDNKSKCSHEQFQRNHVRFVVVTYSMLRQSYTKTLVLANEERQFLLEYAWHRIVLDEAHYVRNPATLIHQAVVALRGRFRCCLTGTPINNTKDDLVSLAMFLRIPPYDSLRWWKTASSQQIVEWRNQFLLRRTNQNALPPMTVRNVAVPMLENEQMFYNQIEQKALVHFDDWLRKKEGDDAMEDEGEARVEQVLLAWLVSLRQACCHPLLVTGGRAATSTLCSNAVKGKKRKGCVKCRATDAQSRRSCLHALCDSCHQTSKECPLCRQISDFKKSPSSSKLSWLCEFVSKRPKGSKTIVFSQWASMLDLAEFMLRRDKGISIFRLDGSVPDKQRERELHGARTCSSDATVFLCSIGTCAHGLNMQFADCIVLLEQGFNPQIEIQARFRVHRIGQTRPVSVHRLLTQTRLDDGMTAMHNKKLSEATEYMESDKPNVHGKRANMSDIVSIFMSLRSGK
jgi:SNF2 family DNA or RNA helicase